MAGKLLDTYDFESGVLPTYANDLWQISGVWSISTAEAHTGSKSLCSPTTPTNNPINSQIVIADITCIDGYFSFWAKCSAAGGEFSLSIDSVPKFQFISGPTIWTEYKYHLTAGVHSFGLIYANMSNSSRLMYFDDFSFPVVANLTGIMNVEGGAIGGGPSSMLPMLNAVGGAIGGKAASPNPYILATGGGLGGGVGMQENMAPGLVTHGTIGTPKTFTQSITTKKFTRS
jgi:hypothetical protein